MLGGDVVGWGEMLHWKGMLCSCHRVGEEKQLNGAGARAWVELEDTARPFEGIEAFVLSRTNRSLLF